MPALLEIVARTDSLDPLAADADPPLADLHRRVRELYEEELATRERLAAVL